MQDILASRRRIRCRTRAHVFDNLARAHIRRHHLQATVECGTMERAARKAGRVQPNAWLARARTHAHGRSRYRRAKATRLICSVLGRIVDFGGNVDFGRGDRARSTHKEGWPRGNLARCQDLEHRNKPFMPQRHGSEDRIRINNPSQGRPWHVRPADARSDQTADGDGLVLRYR